jgi:UTP--glucose-1-phosphate uridylyltransferase
VGDEHFAVLLPDDVIVGPAPALGQLIAVADRYDAGVIAVEEVSREKIGAYGVIDARELEDGVFEVLGVVEKPSPEEARSNLGIVGRYVLPPQVFDALERITPGAGGELQLTDAIALLRERQRVCATRFQGTRYDTGNPLGLLQASVAQGLAREEIGPDLRAWLETLLAGG